MFAWNRTRDVSLVCPILLRGKYFIYICNIFFNPIHTTSEEDKLHIRNRGFFIYRISIYFDQQHFLKTPPTQDKWYISSEAVIIY